MPLAREEKQEIITGFATKDGDTGSPEVQVALLSKRIAYLTDHFKSHAKDHHSRRGLLMLVGRRRRLLEYLKKKDGDRYHRLIETFGKATGVPVLLNTSFNLKGEPIVNTPAEAFNTFTQSGMDVLVLEDYVIEKTGR